MEQKELITKAFYYLNAFKRYRALESIARTEKAPYEKINFYALKQYELFDQLELTLRAIQKGHRELIESLDDDSPESEEIES